MATGNYFVSFEVSPQGHHQFHLKVMDFEDSVKLVDELSQLKTWEQDLITIELQQGVDGVLEEVNLVSVLDEIPSSTGRRKFLEEKSNRYYLPLRFNQNDAAYRRNHIVPFFAQACAKVGIEIRNNG